MSRSLTAGAAAAGPLPRIQWAGALAVAALGGLLAGSGAHLLLALLLGGVLGLWALSRPGPFLLAYLLYMPLEEFLLKWVPDGLPYVALRFAPEAALYAMLGALLLRRAASGLRPVWRATPADAPLGAMLLVAGLSALASGAPWLLAAHGVRWLLRYAVVYYLVVHLDWDEDRRRRWIGAILAVAFLQVWIAMAQSAIGKPAWDLLAPDYSKRSWAATDEVKWDPHYERGVFATMGSYFALGTFLALWTLMSLALRWATRRAGWLWAGVLLGAGLLLSYSRQALLGLMIGALILAALQRRRRLLAWVLVPVALYIGIGIWVFVTDSYIPSSNIDRPVADRFLGPFTYDYWRIDYTFHGRSYLLFDVGGKLLHDAPWLGQGPGMFGTQASFTYGSPVYERLKIETKNIFDVYWVDVLGQIGLLGLAAYGWLLWRLARQAWRGASAAPTPFERGLRLGFAALVAGVALSCFFGPSLSDRYLSLYFWFLAGLTTAGETGRAGAR